MIALTLLSFGLAGLWIGTLLAVRGAVGLSERFGLSHGFIGLAVLAVGTDLPELVVAINGALKELGGVDASGMIVGSAVGSAVVQGSVVLGVAGLVAVLLFDGVASRVDGLVMVLVYGVYFAALFRLERTEEVAAELPKPSRLSPTQATIVGMGIVVLCAHMVIEGGLALAQALGMSQTLLAVVFVSAGTSLPELALSVRAAAERHGSLSVGNVIGSNIFDLLVPVGVAALIHPLRVSRETIYYDLPAVALVTVVLGVFLTRRRCLQRTEAIVLIGIYLGYVVLRVATG